VTAAPRILVIQTAFLGDVVLTTPLFRALKEKWPASFVAALVIPETAPALEGLATVDAIICYDKRRRGLRALPEVLAAVRRARFNIVLSPHRSVRSALLARATGAPARVGYRESAGRWLYTMTVRRPMGRHEAERILALAAPLGIIATAARPALAVAAEE